jgi:drug/metabolite transporter (DMT)-like permease
MNRLLSHSPAWQRAGKVLTPATRAGLALATAALLWSGNFIVGRAFSGEFEPTLLNLLRWLICLALMLPWVSARAWRHRSVIAREWRLLLALGATGMAAFHTLVYLALASTTAISALIVLSLAPALIWLGGALTAGVRPSRRQIAGTLLSLAGGALVLTGGRLEGVTSLSPGTGELWMVAAVLAWTIYSLLLRQRPTDLPQDVTLAASVVPAIALLLPAVLLTSGAAVPALTPQNLGALGYVGIFASLVAFLLWSYGVGVLGPERASQFIHLMPVFGLLLAMMLLHERMLLWQAAGALCVFAGLAVAQKKIRKAVAARS